MNMEPTMIRLQKIYLLTKTWAVIRVFMFSNAPATAAASTAAHRLEITEATLISPTPHIRQGRAAATVAANPKTTPSRTAKAQQVTHQGHTTPTTSQANLQVIDFVFEAIGSGLYKAF